MKRLTRLLPAVAIIVGALCLWHPAAALAIVLNDPTAGVLSRGIGTKWSERLSDMAGALYVALFTLELIVVGVQGALYKDNITEFLQTFAFKVIMATAMIAVIGNANTIFPNVVKLFTTTAVKTVNQTCEALTSPTPQPARSPTTSPSPPITCTPIEADKNPSGLETKMLDWATIYFAAADLSRAADSLESSGAGIMMFGTGLPGLSSAFLLGHANFEMFCIALGMMCVMSAGGILLTFVLLTFETQIVMMIGVFFLAFQASRYTAQFAQGFMSYCVNIGVKFFVFYFVVAILGQVTSDANEGIVQLLGSVTVGAGIPFGAGSIALVALSSSIPIVCVISSILVAAIPNFAGSLLSGSSALSAGAAMGQLTSTLQTANSMNNSALQQQRAAHTSADSKDAKAELSGSGGGVAHGSRVLDTPQPVPEVHVGPQSQRFASENGTAPADASASAGAHVSASAGGANGAEGGWQAVDDIAGGAGPGVRPNIPLRERPPDEIAKLNPAEMRREAASTDWNNLDDAQKHAIVSNPALRAAAYDTYADKGAAADKTLKDAPGTDFLTSLAGVAPKGEAPPSAVLVRVSNPDKL